MSFISLVSWYFLGLILRIFVNIASINQSETRKKTKIWCGSKTTFYLLHNQKEADLVVNDSRDLSKHKNAFRQL
jgi:hypothetical protein